MHQVSAWTDKRFQHEWAIEYMAYRMVWDARCTCNGRSQHYTYTMLAPVDVETEVQLDDLKAEMLSTVEQHFDIARNKMIAEGPQEPNYITTEEI